MNNAEVLRICKEEKVRFLRLQFIDIMGIPKNVEVPETQFERALNGEIVFDGSSIQGFARLEEADMRLAPDPATFRIFPFERLERGRVGRLICDVRDAEGEEFEGCPRTRLKKVLAEARDLGFRMYAGLEAEFFLFLRDERGLPTVTTQDPGGYFDLTPIDRGEEARRDMVNVLEGMGLEVEGAHHEVAPGQHEIDFKLSDALTTADNMMTLKLVVRTVADQHGLHATFMPKPIFGVNGSGMHVYQFLNRQGRNAFVDPKGNNGLSDIALQYIGGLLKHAPGFCAVTNPLVNSYKRLVPGFEAPTNVAWSERNRGGPLVRVPADRGELTRCELRMPDPSCNPYLALAVILKSALDGIRRRVIPPPPVSKNIYALSVRERRRHKVADLPNSLHQALQQLKRDKLVQEALGGHIFRHYYEAKTGEWERYSQQVHQWELETYLGAY
ncbi:MAG TPA: type I glutamate--ammonia ligase [Acidobacteriota bacterium]|nr:type I glutamate--ammonia ligase [Acidobacteriota bacterium]